MAENYHRPISATPTEPPKRTTLIALLILFHYALPTAAQQPLPPNQNPYKANISPALSILIVAIVSAFFFLAFFSIYLRRCSGNSPSVAPSAAAAGPGRSRRGAQRGIDPDLLQTFPTLTYSSVKGHKLGKELLECAVCLCEFDDEDTIRLLPMCSHVFHLDCIDVWLASHVTCPVCRSNLADAATADDPTVIAAVVGDQDVEDLVRIGSQRRAAAAMRSRSVGDWEAAMGGGGARERFMLRLPEEVRREILAAGELRRSSSFAVFVGRGEVSGRRGYMEGIGSGRWRSLRVGRSERWGPSARGRGETAERSGYLKNGIFGSFECITGGRHGEDDDDGESSTAPLAKV